MRYFISALLFIITLLCFSCSEDETYPKALPNNQYKSVGDVSFWTDKDFGCGNITVEIEGKGSGTISLYYITDSGLPSCNADGCANFSLEYGNYPYYAYCNGKTWEGSVSVTGECRKVQLTQ